MSYMSCSKNLLFYLGYKNIFQQMQIKPKFYYSSEQNMHEKQ